MTNRNIPYHTAHINIQNWDVYVVEKFRVKLDRLARGKEHHEFLGAVLLEESEEEKEPGLRGTHHIALQSW